MKHRRYQGRIDYFTDGKGNQGREWFSVTVQPDGSRTMRCVCEMDEQELLRDVTLSVNPKFEPLDCFIRLTKKQEFVGSGWFRFTDRTIECETFMADAGRISQIIELETRVRIFACHPLMADGWQTSQFDHTRPERKQTVRTWAHPSPLPDGSTGPLAGVGFKTMEYIGEEEVTVPAGTFKCRRYDLTASKPGAPPLITWVTGNDHQIVKLRWDLVNHDYTLTEFSAD